MYQITSEQAEFIKTHSYSEIKALVKKMSDDTLVTTITNANILEDGFSINRYSSSNNTITLGGVSAGELNMALDNSNGTFDNISLEKTYIEVSVAYKNNSTVVVEIPLGTFYVDEITKTINKINLVALDGMILLDNKIEWGEFEIPNTLDNILSFIETSCGITIVGEGIVNKTYRVKEKPISKDATYRNLLSWCCEIMGVGCFCNYDGEFELYSYNENNDTITIDESDRFDSVINEEDVTVTGVAMMLSSGKVLVGNNDGVVIAINGNQLLQENYNIVLQNLYDHYNGFTMRPFRATTLPMPYVWCYDKVVFNKGDDEYVGYITDITYVLNSNTEIACKCNKGDTATNGITKAMSTLISSVITEDKVSSMIEQSASELRTEINEVAVVHNFTIDDDSGDPILDDLGNPIESVVYEGFIADMKSSITQLSNEIELKVSSDDFTGEGIASRINLSPSTVKIDAKNIDLNGTITANGNFKINTDGTIEAVGGKIGAYNIENGNLISRGLSESGMPKMELSGGDMFPGQPNITASYGVYPTFTRYGSVQIGTQYRPYIDTIRFNFLYPISISRQYYQLTDEVKYSSYDDSRKTTTESVRIDTSEIFGVLNYNQAKTGLRDIEVRHGDVYSTIDISNVPYGAELHIEVGVNVTATTVEWFTFDIVKPSVATRYIDSYFYSTSFHGCIGLLVDASSIKLDTGWSNIIDNNASRTISGSIYAYRKGFNKVEG